MVIQTLLLTDFVKNIHLTELEPLIMLDPIMANIPNIHTFIMGNGKQEETKIMRLIPAILELIVIQDIIILVLEIF